MSRKKTCSLCHDRLRASHHKRHQEHSPGEPYHIEGNDEERDFLSLVILRICVRQAENEGYEK